MITTTAPAVPDPSAALVHAPAPDNAAILADYLAGKRSPRTRAIYGAAVREFLAIASNRPLAAIGRTQLAGYGAAAVAALDRGAAPSTVALRVQSVRTFLAWAHEEELFPITPARVGRLIERPRIDRQRQYPVLTGEQAAALLATAAASSPREWALVAVMLGGGLRVAEVADLSIGSLRKRPDGRLTLDVLGKGRKRRQVSLPPAASGAVLAYLAHTARTLSDAPDTPVFLSLDRARKGAGRQGRITTRSIGRIVGTLAAAAGIQGEAVSPHALRHTAAVHWLRAGLELHEVARLLGHASIVVTQRYIDHIRADELADRMPEMIGDGGASRDAGEAGGDRRAERRGHNDAP